ncbi:15839_t:CDS:10 [Funneliformis geosporum]|uniref:15839_t:CDS:1 n=1 Tax=Funneliformis geosporum TaxID=1117311 RepID=A0A9W4SQ16_9GLOM|nr:15839_t:CDS:10 [Funneliformis geosporum]
MPYGKSHMAGYATRNQKAKLAADYQELLKELSTTTNIQSVGNYVLEKTLGEGSYGKVKLATHKLTGRQVAIKIIPKIHAENLTREIHHHRYLHHPNIISLLEVISTESKIYIVLEYCEGGELYDFLVERGRLRENLARKLFGQLCRAVKYCHDRRVVHRDLKLENILLDSNNNIKLADFGFTRECESKRLLETICGSTGYSAPEAKDLIRSILQLEPSERPTLKQILQHNSVKEPIKEVTISSSSKDIHIDATSHLERQRQEIFLATRQHNASLPNHYPMTFTRHSNSYDSDIINSTAPSAFKSRFKNFSPAVGPSPPKVWGPSTSKTSRRSSIDSKAFNEKVFFTTPEEKELLEKLENLGLDITGIKDSVLEGKVDSASGLWWLLLAKLREKRKIEGVQSSVTMVNVAVGTSDEEIEIAEETEEYDSSENSIELDRLQEEIVKDVDSTKTSEKIMSPPTPPPKTYHAAPASRERRKSLILSLPEAVEPVLTTITATASPPLSPKKYSSFTSPISSRSVRGLLSTIRGWWGGSHNPKDVNSAYKKSMLNWAESGVVVPADVVHVRRLNRRRSGSKTPPGFEGANSFSLSRRSSMSRSSLRDKKKRRIPIQGIKGGNKRATPTPAPLMIPPVTPSIVLSQSSPTSMSPIPGTPPASRPKTLFTKNRRNPFAYQGSSRKQVKRRSINSINNLLDNFNSASGSENIIPNDEETTIDERLIVVDSTNPSQRSKSEHFGLQKVDNRKISEDTLISISSDVIKPDETIVNPPSFSSSNSRQPSSTSISFTPPRHQSQTSPVSPPLSPIESVVVPSSLPSMNVVHKIQVHSNASRKSVERGKQSEVKFSPIEKPTSPSTKSVMILISTPPESPKLSTPTPSTNLNPQSKFGLHTRSYTSPSAASSLNNNNGMDIEINNKRDSSHPPPNMNASQMMFLQNNGRNTRQKNSYLNPSSSIISARRPRCIGI